MTAMHRLVGMPLRSSTQGPEGQVTLQFKECDLAVFTPWQATVPLEALVGQRVTTIESAPGSALRLSFDNGDLFTASLRADDYSGPEAFAAYFRTGEIVVG